MYQLARFRPNIYADSPAAYRRNNQYLRIGRDLRCQPVGKTNGIFSHKDVDVLPHLALLVNDPVTQAGLELPQRFKRR